MEGLSIYTDIVSPDIYNEIVSWYNECFERESIPVPNIFTKEISKNSRKVIHYGFIYDYSKKEATATPTSDLPKSLEKLRQIVLDKIGRSDLSTMNQCIVNRYLPGQGISAHVDHVDYGPIVASFTFNILQTKNRKMRFTNMDKTIDIETPNRSLYIMTGPSRYVWKHSMPGSKTFPEIFSVTFRTKKE